MSVPSKAELERFFGPERAEDVRFLEAVTSWPSLRILDFLYSEGPSSTGDISRELNMDMREVRDRLEVLNDFGIVAEKENGWVAETDEVNLRLRNSEGIDISRDLGEGSLSASQSGSDSDEVHISEDGTEGLFTRVRSTIRSLI